MRYFGEYSSLMNETFCEIYIELNIDSVFDEWNASVNKMVLMNELFWWLRCFNECGYSTNEVFGERNIWMNELYSSINIFMNEMFQWIRCL